MKFMDQCPMNSKGIRASTMGRTGARPRDKPDKLASLENPNLLKASSVWSFPSVSSLSDYSILRS